jgi:hypothetical protein
MKLHRPVAPVESSGPVGSAGSPACHDWRSDPKRPDPKRPILALTRLAADARLLHEEHGAG